MTEERDDGLKVIDGLELPEKYRAIYRPGQVVSDAMGRAKRLPRFFYEIPDRDTAWEVELTPHFALGELLRVDLKEAEVLRDYPRYVPCAIRVLATYLERLRDLCSAPIFISVNGGYRSPDHKGNTCTSTHSWGAAADVYRIGSTILDDEQAIMSFRETAMKLGPEVRVFPYGHEMGETDDHLHIDLGFIHLIPPEAEDDLRFEPSPKPPERRQGDRRSTDE